MKGCKSGNIEEGGAVAKPGDDQCWDPAESNRLAVVGVGVDLVLSMIIKQIM